MKSILYLTRNGALEPLGQSQVLSYLRGLAKFYRFILITHEKPQDWTDSERMQRVHLECTQEGISWQPRLFHHQPPLIAPAISLIRMIWEAWRLACRGEILLIHARSYLPAAAAWVVWRLTGTPFIFDMRALWPEELITAGRLRRGSLLHRLLVELERSCLRDAAGVVSLTHAAVAYLKQIYPQELDKQRIAVIPTCTDLDRFTPLAQVSSTPRVYGCVGTLLSGWFCIDWLAAWIAIAAERDPEAQFEIITRDNAEQVRRILDGKGNLGDRLQIRRCDPHEIPEVIRRHTVSIIFYSEGSASIGRSPTRMGEVLSCGRPVIANRGVGDVEKIILEYRVGILLEGIAPEQVHRSLEELDTFLADPDLVKRCRCAAEEVFSLQKGVERYRQLYQEILKATK